MTCKTMTGRRGVLLAGLAVPMLTLASTSAHAASPLLGKLSVMDRFLGTWKGEGQGQPGTSHVERSYEPALGGRFLVARNTSRYEPQPKNPKGETHQDVGWYSFDDDASTVVLRQFHGEGFVSQYVAPASALAGEVLVFNTVTIENIPPGWRARETFTFHGPDAFDELFELAEPGKAFETYSLNRLRRG